MKRCLNVCSLCNFFLSRILLLLVFTFLNLIFLLHNAILLLWRSHPAHLSTLAQIFKRTSLISKFFSSKYVLSTKFSATFIDFEIQYQFSFKFCLLFRPSIFQVRKYLEYLPGCLDPKILVCTLFLVKLRLVFENLNLDLENGLF